MSYRWGISIGGEILGTASPPSLLVFPQEFGPVKAEDGDIRIRSVYAKTDALFNWLMERPSRKIPLLELHAPEGRKYQLVDVWCRSARKSPGKKARAIIDVFLCPRFVKRTAEDRKGGVG